MLVSEMCSSRKPEVEALREVIRKNQTALWESDQTLTKQLQDHLFALTGLHWGVVLNAQGDFSRAFHTMEHPWFDHPNVGYIIDSVREEGLRTDKWYGYVYAGSFQYRLGVNRQTVGEVAADIQGSQEKAAEILDSLVPNPEPLPEWLYKQPLLQKENGVWYCGTIAVCTHGASEPLLEVLVDPASNLPYRVTVQNDPVSSVKKHLRFIPLLEDPLWEARFQEKQKEPKQRVTIKPYSRGVIVIYEKFYRTYTHTYRYVKKTKEDAVISYVLGAS